jgi:hypothetical protein
MKKFGILTTVLAMFFIATPTAMATPPTAAAAFAAMNVDGEGDITFADLQAYYALVRNHDLDTNQSSPEGNGIPDWQIDMGEILRGIQFLNSQGYHIELGTEDGFAPGPGEGVALTLTLVPVNGGTVTLSRSGPYSPGTTVTLTAHANEGYTFGYFLIGDDTTPQASPYNLTITTDTTVTAVFVPVTGEGEGEGEGEQLPDLSITRLNVPQGPPTAGDDDFEADIATTQVIDTPFTIIWKIDGTPIKTKVIDNLSTLLWIEGATWPNPTVGTHELTLTIDSGNGVAESNETNNVASFALTVTGGEGEGEGEAPVIHIDGPLELTVECGQEYSDDSYVTDDSGVASLFVNTILNGTTVPPIDGHTLGVFTVEYRAEDGEGYHAALITRTITVEDTTAPVITLNGPASVEVIQGTTYTELATATDTCDTNLTVVVTGDSVDTSTLGTYAVTYNVEDSSGNAAVQVTRTVEVVPAPTNTPTITTQPQSVFIDRIAGDDNTSITFQVRGTGTNLTYQWEKSGNNIATPNTPWTPVTRSSFYDVSGWDTDTLTVITPQTSDSGWVRCVVSDDDESVVSEDAWLMVYQSVRSQVTEVTMGRVGSQLTVSVTPGVGGTAYSYINIAGLFKSAPWDIRMSIPLNGTTTVTQSFDLEALGVDSTRDLPFEVYRSNNSDPRIEWVPVYLEYMRIRDTAGQYVDRDNLYDNGVADDYRFILPAPTAKSAEPGVMKAIIDAIVGIE